jgi:hypothetical protein
MTRTFWLSFADPAAGGFLGVCVIDVTDLDAEHIRAPLLRRHPHAPPDSEWLGAAVQKAWDLGCNPGGAIQGFDITPAHDIMLPRGQLLTEEELDRYARERATDEGHREWHRLEDAMRPGERLKDHIDD